MYSAPHPPTAGNANLRLARCRDGVCPRSSHSGTQPPPQHSAFFSTAYAVPILQVLFFDIHPSNGGGGVPPLLALRLIAKPAQRPPSRLQPPPTAQSGPGTAPRDTRSSSGPDFLPPPPAARS